MLKATKKSVGNNFVSTFSIFPFILDADKKQQGFQPDEKSIRVIGFVAKEKMPKNKILSDGNMVFFPTEGNPVSSVCLLLRFAKKIPGGNS